MRSFRFDRSFAGCLVGSGVAKMSDCSKIICTPNDGGAEEKSGVASYNRGKMKLK